MAIEIIKFKEYRKNTLRGFLDVRLANGLEIKGCTLHEKGGERWVGLPSKAYQKDNGTQAWMPIVAFSDKEARYRFQDEILSAIERLEKGNEGKG